jgi:hypothetical protein
MTWEQIVGFVLLVIAPLLVVTVHNEITYWKDGDMWPYRGRRRPSRKKKEC